MILNAIAEKLKRTSKDDSRGGIRGLVDPAGGLLVFALSLELP